jgi:hypothetical protein
VAFLVMREGGSNSHAECRQEHQWCNQESAHNSQRVRADFDPLRQSPTRLTQGNFD